MARTSAKAKKPSRQGFENNPDNSIETKEGNKSKCDDIMTDSIEMHNKVNDTYEVDKIIDSKENGGETQYLVRWKGYKEESDTWENESALQSCSQSLEAFKRENMQSSSKKHKAKVTKIIKTNCPKEEMETSQKHPQNKRKQKIGKRTKSSSRKKIKVNTKQTAQKHMDESDHESTDGINYEVEKIIEMRIKKNGSKEFLIRWKGYDPSRDTWEPESHLNCKEMISRFIEQVTQLTPYKTEKVEEVMVPFQEW